MRKIYTKIWKNKKIVKCWWKKGFIEQSGWNEADKRMKDTDGFFGYLNF